MKLLFVTPYLPSPPVYGGQRRIHGLITRLAERHEVSIASLAYSRDDYEHAISLTREYCREVIVVPETWHRVDGKQKRMRQIMSLLSSRSWEDVLYRRPKLRALLDAHLAQHDYDAIIVEFSFMGCYTLRRPGARRPLLILDEHNIEYDLLRRTADATGFARKVFQGINWRKLRREEVKLWRAYDGVSAVSTRDRDIVRAEAPSAKTAVVPNGVDTEFFVPNPQLPPVRGTLLFFGAMNYYPNTDAAVFFVNEVIPRIVAQRPDVELRIVGAIGEGAVPALAGPNVNIVGFAEDIRVEIARAAVVIAPLRIGGGTRLKILEAMSMAKAVVATRIGAEGIDVRDEHDILLADDPADQAAAILRLLDEPGVAERIGSAARKTVLSAYGWEASAAKLERFIEERLAATSEAGSARG